MPRLLAMFLVAGLLAACSSQQAPPVANSATPAPAVTNALAGTPMASYGHDLNKARNVQNIINQQAQKQAKAIGKATGSGG